MASEANDTYTTNNIAHDVNDTHRTITTEHENQRSASLPSWFVVQLTFTASLGGCLFGYDMGAISGTLPQLTNTFDLNDRQKELGKMIRFYTIVCIDWLYKSFCLLTNLARFVAFGSKSG